jgi:hypothetical protein
MEVFYTVKLGDETHKVKAKCACGNCSLLSTKQLEDLREKVSAYKGVDSPEEIKVICN